MKIKSIYKHFIACVLAIAMSLFCMIPLNRVTKASAATLNMNLMRSVNVDIDEETVAMYRDFIDKSLDDMATNRFGYDEAHILIQDLLVPTAYDFINGLITEIEFYESSPFFYYLFNQIAAGLGNHGRLYVQVSGNNFWEVCGNGQSYYPVQLTHEDFSITNIHAPTYGMAVWPAEGIYTLMDTVQRTYLVNGWGAQNAPLYVIETEPVPSVPSGLYVITYEPTTGNLRIP